MKKEYKILTLIISSIILILMLVLHLIYEDQLINGIKFDLIITLPITLAIYLINSYQYFIKAFKNIKKGNIFDEITLTLLATIAAFAIGEYIEGLAVILFFNVGEYLEDLGYKKSKKSVESIYKLRPENVTLYKDNKEIITDPFDVNLGDIFIVKPGERIPLDGIVINGNSSIDTSSMTGESLPKNIKENDEVISGTLNLSSPLIIKSTSTFYNSTISKVLDMVENATNKKTKEEKFISKFAKFYTPIVVILALIVSVIPPLFIGYNNLNVWSDWIFKGATFLVVSCPCSLVISVPMAFFIGIGKASKYQALIKGSVYIEKLSKLDTIVLDKTGTITMGNFEVSKINNFSDKYNILELAKAGEFYSNHPIAKAINNKTKSILIDEKDIKDYKEISGKGIKLIYKNKLLLIGNNLLLKDNNINIDKINDIGTVLYISYDNNYIGNIIIKDLIKEDSKSAINNFYNNNINNIYMLTGDNENVANEVAKICNINNVYSSLLPQEKGEILTNIINDHKNHKVVAFVGDGINDAPSLKLANIGISMGSIGSDVAIEASDVVLLNDKLNTINILKKLAKSTLFVVYLNIILSIAIKILVMILSLTGILGSYAMWLAIFGDVGVTLICILNSLTLMKRKFK